jgi:tetratricopeptide (TPR) repeat protein
MFDAGISDERLAALRQKVKDNELTSQEQALQDARREWLKLKGIKVKEEGNDLLTKQKLYDGALEKYLEALELFTEGRDGQGAAICLCNASTCLLKLEKFQDAFRAAQRATNLLPNYARAHRNLAKAAEALERPQIAKQSKDYANQILEMQKSAAAGQEGQEITMEQAQMLVPEELREQVTILTYEHPPKSPVRHSYIFVLGTAHISKKSVAEAGLLVEKIRPQKLFLELCHGRQNMLDEELMKRSVGEGSTDFYEMVKQVQQGKAPIFTLVYSWFISSVGLNFDVMPGAEFREAFRVAKNLGASTVLGDMPVTLTVQRLWARLTRWEKVGSVRDGRR